MGNENKSRPQPKGGRRYPQYSLNDLGKNIKKLCNVTHTKPITISQLNVGVFGVNANSIAGKIRSSALKQFGLIEGSYAKLSASELCRRINSAVGDEKEKLLREAFFNVGIFKETFETFQKSTEEKTRIVQYAANPLNVHPEKTANFAEIFIHSAESAGLCSVDGNRIKFVSGEGLAEDVVSENIEQEDTTEDERFAETKPSGIKTQRPNLEIKIDPTLDPEKLEKQLKILKKFGLV
jgi:hypothetical protein